MWTPEVFVTVFVRLFGLVGLIWFLPQTAGALLAVDVSGEESMLLVALAMLAVCAGCGYCLGSGQRVIKLVLAGLPKSKD